MTQFALVTTSNAMDGLRSVESFGDEFLLGVAAKLFPGSPLNKVYLLNVGGKDVDSLMLDAQKAVIDNKVFQKTELYKVVNKVAQYVDDFVFWYGSDYDELEYVYDVADLLGKLEREVGDSFCEAYVHYKKAD
ncbi:hypothetical protein [Shewanella sp. YLB-07]|uniref:hypothetical protein n=1 Tax=Shewanella sp. YLB-07 TaxID=2601268 RepID=UPI00128C2FD0|nr:hypothetical protein [Shewanella sp. YLB-07]MPY26902.1 hypothetical protein [Shewanella sp. YLB-07]